MSEIDSLQLKPGFENPVLDSQAIFRAVLNAFAYPGRIRTVAPAPEPPFPLYAATAAFCLALADMDTPVWLDAKADCSAVRDFLRFHCGCPLVRTPGEATFAVIADTASAPRLSAFSIGDDRFPDRSATVVFQAPSLAAGQPLVVAGPGINEQGRLSIDGLPTWFWDDWAANYASFPLGIDLVLTCGPDVIAMPRSIRVVT
jgi:alpha-D-ribose 1-methylphosphonate 5-triphosphate synthase subunit PhnH